MNAIAPEEFGSRLRRWREGRGLSLRRLALQSGVGKSTLSGWEAGKHLPALPELEAALRALDVSTGETAEVLSWFGVPRAVGGLRAIASETGPPPPSSGELLRAMRLRARLSQARLAAFLGVNQATVARWERSEIFPSPERLERLCVLLGAHPDERYALTDTFHGLLMAHAPLEELESRMVSLARPDLYAQPLIDLRFLSLLWELWHRAIHDARAAHLLCETYGFYAQFLWWQERPVDAGRQADYALAVAERHRITGSPLTHALVHALAFAVHSAPHLIKNRAERMLAELDRVQKQEEKQVYLWQLADIAALEGDDPTALRYARMSLEWAGSRESLIRAQTHVAVVYLSLGQPEAALNCLPDCIGTSQPAASVLRAEAFYHLGDRAAAHAAVAHAASLLHETPYEHFRQRLNRLARRL